MPKLFFGFFLRVIRYLGRGIKNIWFTVLLKLPYFHFIKNTTDAQSSCTFKLWFMQKIIGFNREVYWPVHFTSKINNYHNICVGVDSNPGIEPGCYIQGAGKVYIGDYTQIAQNVGIISGNHDLYDTRKHVVKNVKIGRYCWLGMNVVVLPGVVLGDFTIVGAGAVVTKSFPDGYCVVAGNPAIVITTLDIEKCEPYYNQHEYVGYIPKADFEAFRGKKLWL